MSEGIKIQRPRGTCDILPDEAAVWHFVEGKMREIASLYGYREIRTPVFEHTNLFVRSVGEVTDIVGREMYTFEDRAGRSLTLRPEGTAPVIRAYIENSLHRKEKITRVYYSGPIFRYEKPQAGRYRQHHQFGVEAIGIAEPEQDAEVIQMAMRLYDEIGLKGLTLLINSVGCAKCRPGYNSRLKSYLGARLDKLCRDCVSRAEKNPLRVFDCKNAQCRAVLEGGPRVMESVCAACAAHFARLRELLGESGILFQIKPELVRGIDYYTRTAFEIVAGELGAQNAVGGGGRYDDLVRLLGGPQVPAVGFGTGLERIITVMGEQGVKIPPEGSIILSVVAWEEEAAREARRVLDRVRMAGIPSEMDYSRGSLKSQLRRAHRLGIPFVLILGKDEIARGKAKMKDMRGGREIEVDLTRAVEIIKREMKLERDTCS